MIRFFRRKPSEAEAEITRVRELLALADRELDATLARLREEAASTEPMPEPANLIVLRQAKG